MDSENTREQLQRKETNSEVGKEIHTSKATCKEEKRVGNVGKGWSWRTRVETRCALLEVSGVFKLLELWVSSVKCWPMGE